MPNMFSVLYGCSDNDVYLSPAPMYHTSPLSFCQMLLRMGGMFGLNRTNRPFESLNRTLLERNLLLQILRRPGARALPESPGEALSRFRDDVNELPMFALWLNDLYGYLLFGGVAPLWGQAPAGGGSTTKAPPPVKSGLEEALAQALKSNPDLKVAAAKLNDALVEAPKLPTK